MDALPPEVREQIERKRQEALAKRQQLQSSRKDVPVEKAVEIPVQTTSFYNQKSAHAPVAPIFRGRGEGGPHVPMYNSNVPLKRKAPGATEKPKKAGVTGLCLLISATEFKLQCGYNQALQALMKGHPDSRFDPLTRHYCFKLQCLESLLKEAKRVAPDVTITPLPLFVQRVLQSAPKAPKEEPDLNSVDPKLRKALMSFQKVGVLRGISQNGRILIADDMGLGKTIQSLAIATYFREEWPVLVVCPSSMRFNWKQSFLSWLPTVTESDIKVVTKISDPVGSNQIVIISYDIMTRMNQTLIDNNFRVVIFDESHFLKSFKSQRTKIARDLCARARRILLLSGTPALSRPIELFPQIQCLGVKNFPTVHEFALRYCNAKESRFGWDYTGSSHLNELNILLQSAIMIRRMKVDVLDQLPSKMRRVIFLDPTLIQSKSKQAEHYSQLISNDSLSSSNRRSALLEYFSLSAEMKMKAVCAYVEDMLESGCKFLLFAHHQVMLNAVQELLVKKSVDFIRIDGKVSPEARQTSCDKFQTTPTCRVALLSITAANSGLTLHAASLVLFAELFWNPGILTQAEDRVHRIGQRQNCLVNYLLAKDTSDDFVWPIIEGKLSVLNQVGLSKDTFTDAMTKRAGQTVNHPTQSGLNDWLSSGKSSAETSDDSFWGELTVDGM